MFVMAPKFISPQIDDPCLWLMKTSCLEPQGWKGYPTLKRGGSEVKCYIFECMHLERLKRVAVAVHSKDLLKGFLLNEIKEHSKVSPKVCLVFCNFWCVSSEF